AIINCQNTEVPTAQLACEPDAELRIGNSAREEEILRCRKESSILHKEWPLLREKHLKSLIDGDLRIVGFDLAEVWFEGDVQGDGVMEDNLGIQPASHLGVRFDRRNGFIKELRVGQKPVGIQLNIAARRNPFYSVKLSQLRVECGDLVRY